MDNGRGHLLLCALVPVLQVSGKKTEGGREEEREKEMI